MEIVNVTAVQPATPGSPPDWRTQLGQIVVRVETSDGLSGVGVGGGGRAGIHVVETVLRDLLVSRDSREVESLHQAMFDHTSFYGRTGLVVMAISGVDLALWDLRGKREGRHVAECLGAADLEQPLAMYSTVWGDEEAETAVQQGAAAIKLHVERFGDRPDPQAIADLVRATRERLGSGAKIMMDAFGRWDEESTRRVDEAIIDYQVDWIEEPLGPEDLDGYARLAETCQTPIATGEHEYGRGGFQRLMETGVRILQPDVNWCGGLTTLLQIYEDAAAKGVRVCPHRGSEPFALPAILAIDPIGLAESPRSWFNCLTPSPRIQEALARVNPGIGFGVEFKEEFS